MYPPQSAPGLSDTRYLHTGHFAFMRAVVQGMDSRDSWNRYLQVEGAHTDRRQVRRTIGWIRDVFAAAARRHGRPGTARLVVMDMASLDRAMPGTPSLADFVDAQNLENFSESEQLQQYQQHYPAHPRAHSRHARLMARQLDALNWLQQIIAQAPQPDDPIANWIHPGLAIHLARAGLQRLADLVAHMDCFGARWWRDIDAIGAGKAARIAAWVAMHPSLSAPPAKEPPTAPLTAPRSAPTLVHPRRMDRHDNGAPAGFVPLDQLSPPAGIDQDGPLRLPRGACRIAAADDLAAIRSWLAAKARPPLASPAVADWHALGSLSHTQRAYWKEAERFMLWLTLERKIGLAAVTGLDCAHYQEFLAAPPATWCAPRGRGKWHPAWRPFEGPLSLSGRRLALTVLRGLYRYLVRQNYLASSPWDAEAIPPPDRMRMQSRRFDARGWAVIDRTLAGQMPTSVNQRLALAIGLLGATGLRLGQLVQARVGDLCLSGQPASWHLRLAASGRAERCLPLPPALTGLLFDYLHSRGLGHPADTRVSHGAHLLGLAADVETRAPWVPCARRPLDPLAGVGAGTLRDQIKKFFRQCEVPLRASDPLLAAQFAAASSTWLRAGRPDRPEHSMHASGPWPAMTMRSAELQNPAAASEVRC